MSNKFEKTPKNSIEIGNNQVIYLNSIKNCLSNMIEAMEALKKVLETIKK